MTEIKSKGLEMIITDKDTGIIHRLTIDPRNELVFWEFDQEMPPIKMHKSIDIACAENGESVKIVLEHTPVKEVHQDQLLGHINAKIRIPWGIVITAYKHLEKNLKQRQKNRIKRGKSGIIGLNGIHIQGEIRD